MGSVLAAVLAGGRGKRMGILCDYRAKPALPFAGNSRVIDYTLSNCLRSATGSTLILTDYQRSSLERYLKRWISANDKSKIIKIESARRAHMGSADAVYQSLDYLKQSDADLVLVLAGDHIYQMDYRQMVDFHLQKRADVTVGVIGVPVEEAHRFGIVTTNSADRMVHFVEKPSNPQSNLVSMGIYVFNRRLLIERLLEDAANELSPHDFGHAVVPAMVNRDRVYAYKFRGYWRDIGNPGAYYEANMELLPDLSFSIDGDSHVLSGANGSSPLRKARKGTIENSLVSPGCVIKGRVENSILSPGVWVDEDAVVKDSLVMKNTFIGAHSVVDRCILDENVSVGKFCYLGLGNGVFAGKWNVTMVGEGVTIPSHRAIGRNCTIMPHTAADDFTGKVLPSGTTLVAGRSPKDAIDREKEVFNVC